MLTFFRKILEALKIVPLGIYVVLVVVGFVAGRIAWIEAQRPDHREKVIAAFGSINKLYGRAQMNRDGSRFTYVGDGKKGSVIYLCETATGSRDVVREGQGAGPFQTDFNLQVWPWSPDDSAFIYFDADDLVVCSAETKQPLISFPVGRANPVSDVFWLNPSEFVFVVNRKTLCHAQRQPEGQWELRRFPHSRDLANLTVVSSNEVAWLQDSLICRIKLPADGMNNPFAEQAPAASVSTNPPDRGLVLWLDASTLNHPHTTPVDRLQDLSVYRNHAVKNLNAPIFNAPSSSGGLNGKGTIHFSSFDSLTNATGLKTTSSLGIKGAAPRSMFAVMRRDKGKSMRVSTGNCGVQSEYCGLCDQNYGLWLPGGTENQFPALPAGWNILSIVCDDTGQKGFVNGVLKGAANSRINTADAEVEIGLRLARNGDSKRSAGSDGDFAELLIYNRALNPIEQRQVEDYLSAKWFGTRLPPPGDQFVWLDPQMSGILNFDYSNETGQFLLIRSENGANSLWRFDPSADKSQRAVRIPELVSVQGAQWIGSSNFSYTSRAPGYEGIFLADISGLKQGRIGRRGRIDWHGPARSGGKLLIFGVISNEPLAGIWQYDLASGQLHSVIPWSDHSFEPLPVPEPATETINSHPDVP